MLIRCQEKSHAPVVFTGNLDPAKAAAWLEAFIAGRLCGECAGEFWLDVKANPLPQTWNRAALFAWGVDRHINEAKRRLGKPQWTIEAAQSRWI